MTSDPAPAPVHASRTPLTIDQERDNWPPDFAKEFQKRGQMMARMQEEPAYAQALKIHYKNNPVDFIADWGTTFDPRNAGTGLPSLMPFMVFERQREFIAWMVEMIQTKQSGVVDKSRDMGASWLAVAVSWWMFLFLDGAVIGFGSRKFELVDNRDDPKCIFDKVRQLLKYTPKEFLPPKSRYIDNLGKLINKENGSSITGEGGDSIGRGGRTTVYFVDEAAFIEHPEKMEAALGENTSCQISISTHNGANTIFNRAVKNYPRNRVFVLDWSHDPRKSQKWFDEKRKEYRLKGLDAEFAREIERNARGSIDNVVIPSHWIRAAIDAHKTLGLPPTAQDEKRAGLDIADAGRDHNAVAFREGWVLRDVETWQYAPDTSISLDKTLGHMRKHNVQRLAYDCIGIGAGLTGDIRQRIERGEYEHLISLPFNAAKSPVHKDEEYMDGQTNKQVFRNHKAQAWWNLRMRFLKTYMALTEDEVFDCEEMISIDSRIKDLEDLIDELTQPTYSSQSGKIVIDKSPAQSRSPNKGDSVMIVFAPLEEHVTTSRRSMVGLF